MGISCISNDIGGRAGFESPPLRHDFNTFVFCTLQFLGVYSDAKILKRCCYLKSKIRGAISRAVRRFRRGARAVADALQRTQGIRSSRATPEVAVCEAVGGAPQRGEWLEEDFQ